MDLQSLGIAPLAGVSLALMTLTIWIINVLKRITCKSKWKWTARIPSGIWIFLAVALPVGACIALNLSFFHTALAKLVPDELGPLPSTSTGLLIGIGAQATYKGLAMAKSAVANTGVEVPPTYTPGNCNDPVVMAQATPEVTVPDEPVVPPADNSIDVTSTVTAQLLYWKDGTAAYILLTGNNGKQKIVAVV